MKITTGGTGVISSQSSLVASTLGGIGIGGGGAGVTPLNYNYTWALDMSLTETTDYTGGTSFTTYEKTSDGIRVALNDTVQDAAPSLILNETNLPSTAHSYGSTAADIPDNSIPDRVGGEDATTHPGRYFSVVMTIDKYVIDAAHSGLNTTPSFLVYHPNGGIILWYGYLGNGEPAYIDGQAFSGPYENSDYTAILGQTKVWTFDTAPPYALAFTDNSDPRQLGFSPAVQRKIDYDITFHGVIFSDVPPNAITLPVEITNPTIGSGPA